MSTGESIITQASEALDLEEYRQQRWTGSFADDPDLVRGDPRIARTAFERIYDMVIAAGVREYTDIKKKILHHNFFDDSSNGGKDSIYGLGIPLMKRVNLFRSAAPRYGTERRFILRHRHLGVDLRLDWAREVLENISLLWKRPVRLDTRRGKNAIRLCHDGSRASEEVLDDKSGKSDGKAAKAS